MKLDRGFRFSCVTVKKIKIEVKSTSSPDQKVKAQNSFIHAGFQNHKGSNPTSEMSKISFSCGLDIKKLSIPIDSFFIPFFRTACLPLHPRSTDSPLQRIKRESAIAPTTQAHSHSNTVEQNLPVAARQKLCFEGWDSGKMRLISCTRHFQRHTRSRQIIKYSTAHTPIIIAAAVTVSFPQKNAVKSSTVTVGINA